MPYFDVTTTKYTRRRGIVNAANKDAAERKASRGQYVQELSPERSSEGQYTHVKVLAGTGVAAARAALRGLRHRVRTSR